MALQMPVYRELTTIESKVFMGMSWRQCLAAVILAVVCGGGYIGLWFGLGMDPNLAMYLIFPPGLPVAIWGWVRPKGLMPEKYLKYILRHYTQREVYLIDGPRRPHRTGATWGYFYPNLPDLCLSDGFAPMRYGLPQLSSSCRARRG